MKKFPWHASLSFRLALVLSGTITIFWLVSAIITFLADYHYSHDALMQRLEMRATIIASNVSNVVHEANNTAISLSHSFNFLDSGVYETNKNEYLYARYYAFDKNQPDTVKEINRALSVVEAFGNNTVAHAGTFIMLNGGVAFSSLQIPAALSPIFMKQLKLLASQKNKEGVTWSDPYKDNNGDWYVLAAYKDRISGHYMGINIPLELPSQLTIKEPHAEDTGLVWINAKGEFITAWPSWAPNHAALKTICPNDSRKVLEGMRLICRPIEPAGWQLALVTPEHHLMKEAVTDLYQHIFLAIILLISLVFTLYFILESLLAKPLAKIVKVLTPHSAIKDLDLLNVSSQDELGRIAIAYNRLLKTVKLQYANLEKAVIARTAELSEAKRLAENASAYKSEQLNSISHEIRTPLNGIVGALASLKPTNSESENQYLVNTALNCSTHLLDIINNLLDFSQIDSGHLTIKMTNLEPLSLIDQVIHTVHLSAHAKGLTLRHQVQASFPNIIYTDGLRLKQILINLLGNAVKFTPAGDINLIAWSEGGWIHFRVCDAGPGIPEGKEEDIFVPFRQLDNYIGGSGLGLPIARSLARLLGGELVLESTVSGASFRLDLPITHVDEKSKTDLVDIVPSFNEPLREPAIISSKPNNSELAMDVCSNYAYERNKALTYQEDNVASYFPWKLNILVVDDVKTNRDIVGFMLHQQGHNVSAVGGGEEALVKGKSNVYDLVIMDVRMPKFSGPQTLSMWRDEANGMLDPDCPVVALTANACPVERERLMSLGFDEYLTKPVTPQMLSTVVEFAADMQLKRGMELELNTDNAVSVLKLAPSIQKQLNEDFNGYLLKLRNALSKQHQDECLEILHALKGLAGQAGLMSVCNTAEHAELLLKSGETLAASFPDKMQKVIHQSLGADA